MNVEPKNVFEISRVEQCAQISRRVLQQAYHLGRSQCLKRSTPSLASKFLVFNGVQHSVRLVSVEQAQRTYRFSHLPLVCSSVVSVPLCTRWQDAYLIS